jgi:hypothetical protein
MIFSKELLLSDDQAITATAASTNHIDLGANGTPHGAAAALGYGPGEGRPVPLEVIVTEAFNNLTSLTVALQYDDNDSFSSPVTVKDQVVLLADLTVGKNIFPDLYLPADINQRYWRLNYTVSGTDPTTGQITAGISGGRQTNQ